MSVLEWLRSVALILGIVATVFGFLSWVKKALHVHSEKNAKDLEVLKQETDEKFDKVEGDISELRSQIGHLATHSDIGEVKERLVSIETSIKALGNIINLLHKQALEGKK